MALLRPVFIAIVRGSSLDALFEKGGINASREREREKERSDPDRVDARVRAIRSRWSGSLAERGREIGPFTLLFSQLSFFPGVVAAVKEAFFAPKREKKRQIWTQRARSGSV